MTTNEGRMYCDNARRCANPCWGEDTSAYGRMYNSTIESITLGAQPMALALDSADPIKNVMFTNGAFTITVPGVYYVEYALTVFSINSGDIATAESTITDGKAPEAALAAVLDDSLTAGILVNNVVQPTALSYSYGWDYLNKLTAGVIIDLPRFAVVNAALWGGCTDSYCVNLLLPNSGISLFKVG